jgi:hypothetical protein
MGTLGLNHAEYPVVSVIAKLSPDTTVETSPIPMRATASTGGSKPLLYCHRSTQYIVHCVGDAIHASEVRIQWLYCVFYCVGSRHTVSPM